MRRYTYEDLFERAYEEACREFHDRFVRQHGREPDRMEAADLRGEAYEQARESATREELGDDAYYGIPPGTFGP